MTVDQQGIRRLGHVGDVGRIHPHPSEHLSIFLAQAFATLAEQGFLLTIEEASFLLEAREDPVRVEEAPVGKDDHVLPVVRHGIGARRIDDHRPVVTDLFLEPRMAVIPIGAGLPNGEFIDEGRAGADAGEAYPWNAIHLERNEQSMPVDRRIFGQVVFDDEPDVLTFAQPYQGRWNGPVDGDRVTGSAVHRKPAFRDG